MTAATVNDTLTVHVEESSSGADVWVRPGSREARARQPRAKRVLRDVAVEFGVCVRPVLLRRTDLVTGETDVVETPCGSTRDKVCPPCAKKARAVRAQQCREGWHLTDEPDLTPDPGSRTHRDLVAERAALVEARQAAEEDFALHPDDQARADVLAAVMEAIADLDAELGKSGVKGRPEPDPVKRRARSTRHRADAPDLPRVASTGSTVGRVYTAPPGSRHAGKAFRPSLFLTVTLRFVRPGPRGRHPGRPERLRLRAGGSGRAALRQSVGPADPEPAPGRRVRPAVLRRRRTPAPARPARAHRGPRHPPPCGGQAGRRRHLRQRLVAHHPDSACVRHSAPAGLGPHAP